MDIFQKIRELIITIYCWLQPTHTSNDTIRIARGLKLKQILESYPCDDMVLPEWIHIDTERKIITALNTRVNACDYAGFIVDQNTDVIITYTTDRCDLWYKIEGLKQD